MQADSYLSDYPCTMLSRLRHINLEQRKLLLSVVTNFLTRVPGLVGLLWFLPLLRFELGTNDYADLLAAIAFSSAAIFLSGGYHLMGRRMIGEAYARNDQRAEADAFMSVLWVNIGSLVLALVVTVLYCWLSHSSTAFFIVASTWVIGLAFQMFDNVRSAYNEQYLGSILLIVFQSVGYAVGFMVLATRQDIVLASIILNGPYVLTSIATLALLVYNKPYLFRGRPIAIRYVTSQGTMLAMADGFIFATLSLSVIWLQNTATTDVVAWFATIVRLFQTFLLPVTLLMLPVSSYMRILWHRKSLAQRQSYTRITLVLGISYGVIVAVSLFILSDLYVRWMLHLPVPNDWSIFVLFAAIVAYKAYSSIAYVVLNENAHLSWWTTAAVAAGVAVGAVTSRLIVDPLLATDAYAMVAGLLILAVLFWNAARFSGLGAIDAKAA